MKRPPLLSWFLALAAFLLAGELCPAWAIPSPRILVVAGTDTLAISAANTLNSDLGASNSVTVVQTGVPADISNYTQIYDVRYSNLPNFSAGEQTQYLDFLNAASGHMIFLMGENSGFNARNTPIDTFIALAGGGTIAAPVLSSSVAETLNVPFNVTPNAISSVTFAAVGLVTSHGTGTFVCTEADGVSGGALYFGQGTLANALTGGLVVVYDVNFISIGGGGVNGVAFRQNMEAIVAAGGTAAGPATPTIGLTSSQNPSAVGQSVTFTATVAATGGDAGPTDAVREFRTPAGQIASPTGTVSFLDGTTVLGSGTLDAGVATYSTAALAEGTHAITARFSGSSSYSGVLSSAVSQVVANAPVLVLSNPTPTVNVPSGGSTSVTLTVANAGAALGSPVTLTTTGLPAGAACTLSSQSVDVSGGAVQVTALITTTPSLTILGQHRGLQGLPPMKGLGAGAGALLIGGVFALPGGRRRRRRLGLFLSVLLVVLMGGLTACSSTSSGKGATAGTPTPAGTYTVAVTASATGATPVTTSIQLTVQ